MTEQAKLREASEWWLRLQEDAALQQGSEWLAWSQNNSENLDAFDRVESLALELQGLSAADRNELAHEFGVGRSAKRKRFALHGLLRLAAAIVLAVAGLIFLKNWTSDATTYATERALHQEVTLSDGSRVTVGASSVVSVNMRADERHIQLREGEAYFQVKQEAARPFVVEAGEVSVTAIGTAFDVRRTGRNVAISVTEGRVRVTGVSDAAVEINAGERISYEPGSQRFKMSAVAPERAAAWRERRLEFVNEPLDVVIANVNRYSSSGVAIVDADVARLTFTGTVLPDSVPAWLNALPSVLPVRVERHGDELRVESASRP
jgi:transmembrane sensor